MPESDYHKFIESKFVRPEFHGFDAEDFKFPDKIFDWQRKVVVWALKLGRAALFLDTGLGKTLTQLSWADAVNQHTGKPVLVLCPIAVGQQTVREAVKFGIDGVATYDGKGEIPRIAVCNYQKLHLLDTTQFSGVVLDESSILKSYTGKIKQQLCELFSETRFRLACTATPAPNDHMELGNHSAFLGVMDNDEMLTRWFINDLANAGVYRLKGHAEEDFWNWVATWACCASKPSDIGGSDEGYDLPPLNIIEHYIRDVPSDDLGYSLFESEALTATTLHKQKRKSSKARVAEVAKIIATKPDDTWLIWCDTDYEADDLLELIPGITEVRGSQSDAIKEKGLVDFSTGKSRVLATKASIAGFGMNWQHCCNMVFTGISYSWEQFYQAARRCWRFGQEHEVNAHVVLTDSEDSILRIIKDKQSRNDELRSGMLEASKNMWHESQERKLHKVTGTRVERGDGWELRLGDCVQECAKLEDDSIGFTITSPPFSNLYIYSDSAFDMGNSVDDEEFMKHFEFLIEELYRVTIPGRLCAIHCKDLPKYYGRDGVAGLKDFPGEVIRRFEGKNWTYHSRVTIWKCPVVEMERTKNHGLLHKSVKSDSTAVRQGMADYLIMFRKPAEDGLVSKNPVSRPNGFEEWPGDPAFDPRVNPYHPSKYARKGRGAKKPTTHADGHGWREYKQSQSIQIWQRLADPVWFHIDQQDTLNYKLGKDNKDGKHICALQNGVVKEAVYLWTNEGDKVLDPFNGIGTSGYNSLLLNREYIGIELKESYFNVSINNMNLALTMKKNKTNNLFSDVSDDDDKGEVYEHLESTMFQSNQEQA